MEASSLWVFGAAPGIRFCPVRIAATGCELTEMTDREVEAMKATLSRARFVAVAILYWLVVATASDARAQDLARNPYLYGASPSTVIQAAMPSSFSVGIRARAARSEYAGDAAGRTEPGMTLGAGLYLRTMLGSHFALQPEVLYSPWEARVDHNGGIHGDKDAMYRMKFAEIPVLIKRYLGGEDGPQLYLAAGPYTRIRLSGEAESPYNTALEQANLDDLFRKWDYGAEVGIGMEGFGTPGSMFFDVRYAVGMTNLFTESDRPDLRARGLTFSLGVGT